MSLRTAFVVLLSAAASCPPATGAATASAKQAAEKAVYQCGGQYQQTPCEGGRALAVSAEPSAEQRQQAKAVADAEQNRADSMRKDRIAREATEAKRQAAAQSAASKAAAKASTKAASHHPQADQRNCTHLGKLGSGQAKRSSTASACKKETYRASTDAGSGRDSGAAKQPSPTPVSTKVR